LIRLAIMAKPLAVNSKRLIPNLGPSLLAIIAPTAMPAGPSRVHFVISALVQPSF
jgi:hypothetical protein